MKTQTKTSRHLLLASAASSFAIMAPAARAEWQLLDDFDSYDNTTQTQLDLDGTNLTGGAWSSEFVGTANASIVDSDRGQSLEVRGGAPWRGAESDISATAGVPVGNTQTIFFQFKASTNGAAFDVMMGLSPSVSNIDSTDAWQDFAVMPFLAGPGDGTADLKMIDAGLVNDDIIPNVALDVWYNVWYVIDNAAETYEVFVSNGTDDGTSIGTANVYRNGFTGQALNALGFMAAGGDGSLVLVDNIYYDSSGANSTFPIENPDSDGDGLPDQWEIDNGLDETDDGTTGETSAGAKDGPDGALGDPDGDGDTNLEEFEAGSDPQDINSTVEDIDADGIDDLVEDEFFGNNDGVVQPGDLGQDRDGDFDRDFATNGDELDGATDPADASFWPDGDNDGLNDAWELANGLSPEDDGTTIEDNGPDGDPDEDGSDNLAEQIAGSDPQDDSWTATNAILAHRWSFDGDLADSVGGSDAMAVDPDADGATGGGFTQNPTSITLEGGAKPESTYVSLGSNLLSGTQATRVSPITLELWATRHSVETWSRLFAFGVDDAPALDAALFMSWSFGDDANNDRVDWNGRGTVDGSNAPYIDDIPYHVVMTITPAVYSDGAFARGAEVEWWTSPAQSSQAAGHPLLESRGSFQFDGADLSDLVDTACNLGRSMYGDDTANATYHEMRIWRGKLTETERELFHLLGPDNFDRADVDNGGLGDGFPDQWEIVRFGDTATATVGGDSDGDGDDDDLELLDQTDPDNADSFFGDADADGLDDFSVELVYWNNLLQTPSDDPDGDGLDNQAELDLFTDPVDSDSDDDGFSDGYEVARGSDPLLMASVPVQDGGWTLFEDFEGPGMIEGNTLNGVNGWTSGPLSVVGPDPESIVNQVGELHGDGDVSKPMLDEFAIIDGNTGTMFFQLRVDASATLDRAFVLSDVDGDYFNGEVNLGLNGVVDGTPDFYGRNPGGTNTTYAYPFDTWMNVWLVADTLTDTYDMWVESPDGEVGMVQIADDWVFRNSGEGAVANTLLSFIMGDFDDPEDITYIDNLYVDPTSENLTNPLGDSGGGDSDNDGMDDTWEETYGLIVGVDDSMEDLDTDGTDNLTEFRLGLIPNDGSSFFGIMSTDEDPSDGFTFSWPSLPGTSFTIRRTTDFSGFLDLETGFAADGSPATSTSYTDPTPPAGAAYYTIELE